VILRRYEGFFKEGKVFLFFLGGMMLGLVIAVIHMLGGQTLLILVLFAVFEESAKLIILNMPRFHLKYYTVYYGAGLGLGIGSMQIVAIAFNTFMGDPSAFGNALTIFGFIVLSFNFCLLHSSTGIVIGYGCAKGKVYNYFIRALVFHGIYSVVLFFFLWTGGGVKYAWLFVATVIALGMLFYVMRELLPKAVPQEMLQKKRREARRRAREGMRKGK
jgi:heme exporter protein D